MEVNEIGKSVQKNVMSLLSNKPMWVFWIVYSALSGILFGAFYTVLYLMMIQWWIPIIIIIAIGILWGSVAWRDDTSRTLTQ